MQPRSDLANTSRSCDVEDHRAAVLTDLLATVNQILGLQLRHVGDIELQSQLRRAAAELESLISHLLHTDGSGASRPPAPRSSASTPRRHPAEQAFLVWLAEPTGVDELPVDGTEDREPLARVLGELSLSERILPAETAAAMGLPGGTTVGHAASELLLAVKDPAGPRCRSFRAAVFYLRGRDRGRVIELDAGRVGR